MKNEADDFAAMRFGLGPARPGDSWSPDEMVGSLVGLLAEERLQLPPSAKRITERSQITSARRISSNKPAARKRFAEYLQSTYRSDVHQRILWGVMTRRPFVERLLAFWSNHFTVSRRKGAVIALAGPYEAEALLPNIGGRFIDLLKAAVKHPAMLLYLDQSSSVGPNSPFGKRKGKGLNENLAREILELHTLGVHGGYSQTDVTEFARILTGWRVDLRSGAVGFHDRQAEPGAKSLLGRRFGGARPKAGDVDEALDFIASQPATARNIATKLVTHFISDVPPPDAVAAVEKRFIRSGGSLPEVCQALAELPDARERPGAKARNDRDFLIAALRAANLSPGKLTANKKAYALTVGALALLRQNYWDALSPAGWPEVAEEWLSSIGLAGRLEIIPRIVHEVQSTSPAELLERALGATASERTREIVAAASNREEAMALVFASPEFNRR